MSPILYFSPAFKPSLSLSDLPSSSHEAFKKRKRGHQPSDSDGGDGSVERLEADSATNGTSLPSGVTTSLVALHEDISRADLPLHSPTSSHNDHSGLDETEYSRSFPHHMKKTAPLVSKGRISNELATLKPSLYVATGSLPTATAERFSTSMGLRQHHLSTITAILHRCLLDRDYIRAGRAWAILLRAEQNGYSMDLRTHGRWGVGAEILMQRESQMTQKTLDHNVVETSTSTCKLGVKAESMENGKEYYERIILQYPYRKAFPDATGPLDFSIAMFSLWIYTVRERSSIALLAIHSSDSNTKKINVEANDEDVQRSSASDMEPDRRGKHEQVKRDTLQSAHEIAKQLDGLLESPPYSDNAKFWKLYGEVFLWIADLLEATSSSKYGSTDSGDDEGLIVGSSSTSINASRSTPSNDEDGAERERQRALEKAKAAFQRVKIGGESTVE